MSTERKTHGVLSNLLYVYQHMWKWHKESVFYMLGNTVVTAIAPFIWVFAPKLLIDELLGAGRTTTIVQLLAVTALITVVVHYLKEYFVGVFRMKMSRIRMMYGLRLHEKAMTLPYGSVESPDRQNELRKATNSTSNPYRGFGGVMLRSFTIFGYGIGIIGYVAIITTLHPLILLYLLVNVGVMYWITDKTNKYEHECWDTMSPMYRKSEYIANTMTNFEYGKDIRIYQMKDLLLARKGQFDRKREGIRNKVYKKELIRDLTSIAFVLFRDGLVYGYITYLVLQGQIGFGSFIMYAAAIGGFAVWVQEFMEFFAHLVSAGRYVDDYRKFMEIEGEDQTQQPNDIPSGDKLAIEFDQVNFTYEGADKAIFEDLSLTIEAGQKLAIVGVNGAGKTTLVKLLTGLYRPNSGTIKVDGVDCTSIPLDEYYKLFSVVFQEFKPLAVSVAENIASIDSPSDYDLIWQKLMEAGLKDKIQSLPKELDTTMLKVIDDEGVDLSGGEKQKLALARALYKNGPIVVLDEPTAALDPLAEKEIYENFNNMIADRTAIFISHRLSSTKFCDKIAFFDGGKIVEYGTHEELMALDGQYAHMFSVQAQYYIDGVSQSTTEEVSA